MKKGLPIPERDLKLSLLYVKRSKVEKEYKKFLEEIQKEIEEICK